MFKRLIVVIIGILAILLMVACGPRPQAVVKDPDRVGYTYKELPMVDDKNFVKVFQDFVFYLDEDADEDQNVYVAEIDRFLITSHGEPSRYMYHIINTMMAMYETNIKDYPDIQEDIIEVHFYRNPKDFKRLMIDPQFIAFADENTIHFPIILEEDVFKVDEMRYLSTIASVHELEHVFQYWHMGYNLKEYPERWMLEVLASYKMYQGYGIENLNLTGYDTFYITDIYSMMGSKWSYTYGYYLADYLIKSYDDVTLIQILETPDLEALTGKGKHEVFEDWKVFMKEEYGLVYDSKSIQ